MSLPVGIMPPAPKVALLAQDGVFHLLWVSASFTAMARHTESVTISPGLAVKIVEGISAFMSLSPLVAGYRYYKRGTIRIERTELLGVNLDPNAFTQTRRELYTAMCNNLFSVYIPRGPAAVLQYLEHVAILGRGAQTSLKQFLDELRAVNNENTEQIDRYRRDVYAVKVAAELSMVFLGAGPIPLLTQIGVGLGYTIVTNVITELAGMQRCDMIAMPERFTVANASAVAGNVAQEVVDVASEEYQIFQRARQRALLAQRGGIERKLAELAEKGKLRGSDKNLLRALRAQVQNLTYRMIHSGGTASAATAVARTKVRVGGIGVGLYFMREDLQQVLAYATEGEL